MKKHPILTRLAVITAFAIGAMSFSQAADGRLLVYDFGTSSTTYSLVASAVEDHLETSSIWFSNGFIDLARSGANLGGSNAPSLGVNRNVAAAATMAHSAAEAQEKNRWIALRVAPEEGYSLSLDSLSFYANIDSMTGSANHVAAAVRIGDDAATPYTILDSVLLDNVGTTGNGKLYTITLSDDSMLQDVTDSISIRLLFYNEDGSTVTWSQYTRIDDIALNGTLTLVPEASSSALLLSLGALVFVRRRRKN